jgi:hypothetical protein
MHSFCNITCPFDWLFDCLIDCLLIINWKKNHRSHQLCRRCLYVMLRVTCVWDSFKKCQRFSWSFCWSGRSCWLFFSVSISFMPCAYPGLLPSSTSLFLSSFGTFTYWSFMNAILLLYSQSLRSSPSCSIKRHNFFLSSYSIRFSWATDCQYPMSLYGIRCF